MKTRSPLGLGVLLLWCSGCGLEVERGGPDSGPADSVAVAEEELVLDRSGMNVSYLSFMNTDLSGSNFTGANVTYTRFTGSTLNYVLFTGASGVRPILLDTRMEGASFHGATLPRADFRRTTANFDATGANLQYADFWQAVLIEPRFVGADLQRARFESAWVGPGYSAETEAHFDGADMRNVNAQNAFLSGFFWYVDLRGAVLRNATIFEAIFAWSNLSGADLRNISVSNSYFVGANFCGADVTGAYFERSTVNLMNAACPPPLSP